MTETIVVELERKLAKAAGRNSLTEAERKAVGRRLEDLKGAYEAHKETHSDLPPVKTQIRQLSALRDSLAQVEAAVDDVHPALWEPLAVEKDLAPEVTRALLAVAHEGRQDSGPVLAQLGALSTLREAAEAAVERLQSRDSSDGREYPVPLELVVDRAGYLFSSITGHYPQISAGGIFVRCMADVLEILEPGAGKDLNGEAVKRAIRYCIEHVWLKHP